MWLVCPVAFILSQDDVVFCLRPYLFWCVIAVGVAAAAAAAHASGGVIKEPSINMDNMPLSDHFFLSLLKPSKHLPALLSGSETIGGENGSTPVSAELYTTALKNFQEVSAGSVRLSTSTVI